MSTCDVREFYEKILLNQETKSNLEKKLKLVSTETELYEVLETEVIPLAKSLGYNFTCEQLLDYEQGAGQMLDDDFLENVTGGIGGFQKVAGVVSLAMLGLNLLAPAISASASGVITEAPQIQIERRIQDDSFENENNFDTFENTFEEATEDTTKNLLEQKVDTTATKTQNEIQNDFSTISAGINEATLFDRNLSELDLFEGDNLNLALDGVLSAIINLTPEDNEGGKYDHFKEILSNADVKDSLINACKILKDDSLNSSTKQIKTAVQLKVIENTMKKAGLKGHYFYGFVNSAQNAYKVIAARQVANEIIENNRSEIEKKMGSEGASSSVSASASANVEGVKIGINLGVSANEGTHEKNFYRTTSGVSVDLSAGFAVPGLASLNLNDKIEFSRALIFRSLEQFLDTATSDEGITSSLNVRAPEIKEITKARSEMQTQEVEAQKTLSTSIEPLLKIFNVISQETKVVLPTLTRTQRANEEKTLKNTVGASAATKALTDAGFTISANTGVESGISQTKAYHAYLSLIDENCLPDFGASSEKLADFLKADNFKKFNEVQNLLQNANSAEVAMLANTITGDLRDYNWSLSVLANQHASKDEKSAAKERKHSIEKTWLSKTHSGRLNMLKAGISLAATLRTSDVLEDNDEVQHAFKELHYQLDTLNKMQTFTKSSRSSKKTAEFSTKHSAKSFGVSGNVALNIPGAGESSLSISYSTTQSEFNDETCEDITIDVKLPVIGNEILGRESIHQELSSIQAKLLTSNHRSTVAVGNAIKLLNTNFESSLEPLEYVVNDLSANTQVKDYVTVSFYFTKSPSAENSDIALPGEELCTKPSVPYLLKRAKATESKAIKTSASVGKVGVADIGVGISNSVSRSTSVIGTHSLNFPANRFNAFAFGMQDKNQKKDISALWTGFKNGQKSQFKEIFKNISKDAHNIRYELQCMYNSILKGIDSNSKLNTNKKDTQKTNTAVAFKDFLNACNAYSDDNSEENFAKASSALDQVLKLNFEHNFMTDYNNVHHQLKA